MSFSLLIALFMAFGFDTPATLDVLPRSEIVTRVLEVLGGLAVVGVVAFALGRVVAMRVAHRGRVTPAIRRFHAINRRVATIMTLAFYGWVTYQLGWPRVIRSGFGLGDVVLVDEALILLPFLLVQGLVLWGFFVAERALRPLEVAFRPIGLRRYLVLRARQSMGLVLPVAAFFSLGQDLFRWQWPRAAEGAWAHPIGLAAMGAIVLVLSPAFIRLAWPTRPLPPGALRDRLERVADRFGFRCTDILVWDTGGALINAGVTGALPWFRYVLLTDALIEDLDPHQVAAVFGHEIGHIAHRHLLYFGFFSLGSLGVMALAGGAIDASVGTWLGFLARWGGSSAIAIVQVGAFVICLGLYFLLVFGHVSRRFERQADVFGCRAVSCGRADCPPHVDLDDGDGEGHEHEPGPLCPVGIRIFAAALANVAMLNGMERRKRSWRHGSIQRRIEFLEGLVGEPESERRFQLGVSRLRVVLALVLIVSVALAVASGSIEHLR